MNSENEEGEDKDQIEEATGVRGDGNDGDDDGAVHPSWVVNAPRMRQGCPADVARRVREALDRSTGATSGAPGVAALPFRSS